MVITLHRRQRYRRLLQQRFVATRLVFQSQYMLKDLAYLASELNLLVLQNLQSQRGPLTLRESSQPSQRCLQSRLQQELLAQAVVGDTQHLKYLVVRWRNFLSGEVHFYPRALADHSQHNLLHLNRNLMLLAHSLLRDLQRVCRNRPHGWSCCEVLTNLDITYKFSRPNECCI